MAKTYIDGTTCKEVTGQFGSFYNLSFNLEKLQQYANEKGYVNVTMSKRREVGQYGDTHYMTLNEFKPEWSKPTTIDEVSKSDISVEDIPFR